LPGALAMAVGEGGRGFWRSCEGRIYASQRGFCVFELS